MRRKLTILLLVEAFALLVLRIYRPFHESTLITYMAFPFKHLAMGLRVLSLSSTTGNLFSIIIYSIFCLLPAVYLIFRWFKNKAHAEDGLLALLSMILFWVIYVMINPADIGRHFGSFELLDTNVAFLGVIAYSIIAGYLILRGMRVFANSETNSILRYLNHLLAVICIILTYGVFGSGLMELVSAFQHLAINNSAPGQSLSLSYMFLVLQYFMNILPFALGVIVIYAVLELIEAFKKDPYNQVVVASVQKIGRICKRTVAAIMLSQISVNVLQLVLGSSVRSSHYTLFIPLLSVVFALITMLLASYFEQVRQLKSDNEMFI